MTTTRQAAYAPVPILQHLIRFESVNPPGNEGPCARWVAETLAPTGAEVKLIGSPERANLVARIPGAGLAPPLMLQGHSDVIPVTGQDWTHPPFDGGIADGHVWGRGAIDMKGGVAMMLSALLRLHAEGRVPAGDVVFALLADEENGSTVGGNLLVREHPELFRDVRYAIGEDGGANVDVPGRRVHPIVVAEKRACWLRATLRGVGGHASRQGRSGTAMGALARLLGTLETTRLPTHVTPGADLMLAALADALPAGPGAHVAGLRAGDDRPVHHPDLAEADRVYLDSVLRHTVNATVVRTTDKINMIPPEITVDLDGRILPGGYTVEDYLAELRALIGDDIPLDLLLEGDPMPAPDLGPFFGLLSDIVREHDPEGLPLPMVTPASTDARLFGRFGISCYGWLPMLLPPGTRYQDAMHAADERVPVDALQLGADCLYDLLLRYR